MPDMNTNNRSPIPVFGQGSPLPQPERVLHSSLLNWSWSCASFHGFSNEITTCYMNSVIQCMQYVPAWSNYLWDEHVKDCKIANCITCVLSDTTLEVYMNKQVQSYPSKLCEALPSICDEFFPYEQQDAHEFLIYFFQAIQRTLTPEGVNQYTEMTTALGKIFGGFLRNQITCQKCLTSNNVYEPYFYISLNINRVLSIKGSLKNYFQTDEMDNKTWYDCSNCRKCTNATKRLTIETPPEVLILHLKMYNKYGEKITKGVDFPKVLDLEPYLSSAGEYATYKLYGVITHSGASLRDGHYRAYIWHPATEGYDWYCIDDDLIYPIEWDEVSQKMAYMLFYIRYWDSVDENDFYDKGDFIDESQVDFDDDDDDYESYIAKSDKIDEDHFEKAKEEERKQVILEEMRKGYGGMY